MKKSHAAVSLNDYDGHLYDTLHPSVQVPDDPHSSSLRARAPPRPGTRRAPSWPEESCSLKKLHAAMRHHHAIASSTGQKTFFAFFT